MKSEISGKILDQIKCNYCEHRAQELEWIGGFDRKLELEIRRRKKGCSRSSADWLIRGGFVDLQHTLFSFLLFSFGVFVECTLFLPIWLLTTTRLYIV